MDAEDDEPSIAELMDAVLTLNSRECEALTVAFRYLPFESLKTCRSLSKDLHDAATSVMLHQSVVRFQNASALQRYRQEFPSMQTVWQNYSFIINNTLMGDILVQFGNEIGTFVRVIELDIKYRETNLTYLEDLFAERLPNLEELTIRGKFPAAATFFHPSRMYGRLEKVHVFNLLAKGWHKLPLANGEVAFTNPLIGHILAAMPNLMNINYFPDVDSPREAHRHYSSFIYNLTEMEHVVLRRLTRIQHFTLSFIDILCMERFAAKGFPLKFLQILVEEEVQPEQLCMFLETFRSTLTHLVVRSATENPLRWPRLPHLEELVAVGVNVHGTDFISFFPALKKLHVSQDRVTTVDFSPDRGLLVPHTFLTCLKIIEGVAVNAAYRLSNTGLSILFRDLPSLTELAIIQNFDSSQPGFTDEGITGANLSISKAELSVRPRDLRVINRNLMRYSHFIGSLSDLQKLTLKATNVSDVSLLCGIVNCQRLRYLDISLPQISESACIELLDYIETPNFLLRIQDFGNFTSTGKSEILVRMKFREVFYAT